MTLRNPSDKGIDCPFFMHTRPEDFQGEQFCGRKIKPSQARNSCPPRPRPGVSVIRHSNI
jgi:hypothetical protein